MHRYQILGTPSDGPFDKVAALAAQIVRTPAAAVTIVDSDRVWFKAAYGLNGTTETDRTLGLCASAILDGVPYVVTDTYTDRRTAAVPLVLGERRMRFYAAAPITTADGYHLGTVNVLDTQPRQVTAEQLAALQNLAALVMDQLEMRLSAIRTVAAERQMRTAAERLARTLQRTLLPPVLPQVPGLKAAAAYHAASADEVGGDFYDLFPLDDGRWAFFLGDVCGKGAGAAALTSLTRYTLRAAAIYNPDPCAVLANLDSVLKGEYQGSDPRYCTAIFGILQPTDDGCFTLTLAGGGHPPALAVRADGTIEPLPVTGGQLIGLLPTPRFTQICTRLAPGDALLLYTDGLTEARTPGGSMLQEEGLAAYLAADTWADAESLVEGIRSLLDHLGTGVHDDTALLALSVPDLPPAPEQETR
ncbi:PP2C family protein-serine/threonine phosphatase [Streptomyces cyaneofuscatus]|uniref:PP2C family protein-serine/threonine phosphatase n=1 Tax=Streptomyces cyaneofuscatus TaxID=66883 RepID=UPI0037A20E49